MTKINPQTIVIGASDVGCILGHDEFKSPLQWWLDKMGIEKYESTQNEATFLGTHLEAGIAEVFANRHDVKLEATSRFMSMKYSWLRATPDRFILPENMSDTFCRRFDVDPSCDVVLLEMKTWGLANPRSTGDLWKYWGEQYSDKVPTKYIFQCMVQAIVTDEIMCRSIYSENHRVNKVILSALLPGRGIIDFVIHQNPEHQQVILDRLIEFREKHIVGEIPPDAVSTEDWEYLASISARDMEEKNFLQVDAQTEIGRLAIEFCAASENEKLIEKAKKEAKAKLINAIGKNYGIHVPGICKVIFTEQGELRPPALQKTAFADEVSKVIKSMSLEEPSPQIDKLMRVLDAHTRRVATPRTLRGSFEKKRDDK